jgi:hypothetical protein
MISTVTMRRLGLWLIALYVFALVGGVTPLIHIVSAHAGAPLTLSANGGDGAIPAQGHHHAGDVDDVVHHHALQDLTGVIALLPRDGIALVHVSIGPRVSRALAEADTVRLERPPKPILSI